MPAPQCWQQAATGVGAGGSSSGTRDAPDNGQGRVRSAAVAACTPVPAAASNDRNTSSFPSGLMRGLVALSSPGVRHTASACDEGQPAHSQPHCYADGVLFPAARQRDKEAQQPAPHLRRSAAPLRYTDVPQAAGAVDAMHDAQALRQRRQVGRLVRPHDAHHALPCARSTAAWCWLHEKGGNTQHCSGRQPRTSNLSPALASLQVFRGHPQSWLNHAAPSGSQTGSAAEDSGGSPCTRASAQVFRSSTNSAGARFPVYSSPQSSCMCHNKPMLPLTFQQLGGDARGPDYLEWMTAPQHKSIRESVYLPAANTFPDPGLGCELAVGALAAGHAAQAAPLWQRLAQRLLHGIPCSCQAVHRRGRRPAAGAGAHASATYATRCSSGLHAQPLNQPSVNTVPCCALGTCSSLSTPYRPQTSKTVLMPSPAASTRALRL